MNDNIKELLESYGFESLGDIIEAIENNIFILNHDKLECEEERLDEVNELLELNKGVLKSLLELAEKMEE